MIYNMIYIILQHILCAAVFFVQKLELYVVCTFRKCKLSYMSFCLGRTQPHPVSLDKAQTLYSNNRC